MGDRREPPFVEENVMNDVQKPQIMKFYDRILELHPEGLEAREAIVDFCQEFINMVNDLGAEKLEPYYYHTKCVRYEGRIEIAFKFPAISYHELLYPQY